MMTPEAPSAGRRRPEIPLTVAEAGPADGRIALVLHGGGGPATVAGLAGHLSRTKRVLTPTHPGWDGAAARPLSPASPGTCPAPSGC